MDLYELTQSFAAEELVGEDGGPCRACNMPSEGVRCRMRTCFAVVVMVSVAAVAVGCSTPRERVPTPSVALSIAKEHALSSGQGMWIGDRILTARHVLASDNGWLPEHVQIDDQLATLEIIASGDAQTLRKDDEANAYLWRQEDWIVASVAGRSARVTPDVLPGDGSVRPGERLYMVGYGPRSGDGDVHTVTLRVPKHVKSDVPVPEGVILAMLPRVANWHGWSGSFVGRYLDGDGQWEFVGIASSVMMDAAGRTQALAIVRPPQEVVQAFFGGASEELPVLVGMPGPLVLPHGYRATSSVPIEMMEGGRRFVIHMCIAQRDNRSETHAPGDPGRVLVSISGCDPGVGWVAVEAVDETLTDGE